MIKAQLSHLMTNATKTFQKLLAIALYLGVLLSLFSIHKALLLDEPNVFYHVAFSFLNGLMLAKVILVGQELHIGDRLRNGALIYVILFKSAVFSLLLFVFRLVEEGIVGLHHGESFLQGLMTAYPALSHEKLMSIILVCGILFVTLIPFFAYLELSQTLGATYLRGLIFSSKRDIGDVGVGVKETSSITAARQRGSDRQARIWYFAKAGETIGPHNEDDIMQFILDGVISRQSYVFNAREGGAWRLLEQTALMSLYDKIQQKD
jgi:hypothetical protein